MASNAEIGPKDIFEIASKFEARNPKHETITKSKCPKNQKACFSVGDLGLVE
jgi:hypothetical protein